MQAMFSGLLEYSRINTLAKPFSHVDCNTVLDHCRLVFQDKIKASKATLTIEPLPVIDMDAEQCMQLFLALLDNALKFHAANNPPDIKVFAEKRENRWLFTVQDNGIGIDPKFYQKIFLLFQRLHTDEEYPGAGIGLAFAKKIVERHGGKIWVDSTPGAGASFRFSIPIPEKS
jgi:chemotaxis family two-component system sensor kinase Cph1